MTKLAIVATINSAPGGCAEYLLALRAHAQRCLANEPGTLRFDILVPHNDHDRVMLYEVYAGSEAFQAHWNGESMQRMRRDSECLHISISGIQCDLID